MTARGSYIIANIKPWNAATFCWHQATPVHTVSLFLRARYNVIERKL